MKIINEKMAFRPIITLFSNDILDRRLSSIFVDLVTKVDESSHILSCGYFLPTYSEYRNEYHRDILKGISFT